MAIIYRTAGAWGAGKGSNLTPAEVDGNFYDVTTRVTFLEDNPPVAVSIDDITATGDQLTITLTDARELTVTLPTYSPNFTGQWEPLKDYVTNDIFTFNGSTYFVKYPHTSALTFDPGANDGMGHDYYKLWLTEPSNALPDDGEIGQILVKDEDTTDNPLKTVWKDVSDLGMVLADLDDVVDAISPTNGDVLTYNGFNWISQAPAKFSTVFTSASATVYPIVGSEFTHTILTSVTGVTLQIYGDDDQPIDVGAEITYTSDTDGTINIVAMTGVTLLYPTGFQLQFYGRGATVSFKKIDTDKFLVAGLLTPAA